MIPPDHFFNKYFLHGLPLWANVFVWDLPTPPNRTFFWDTPRSIASQRNWSLFLPISACFCVLGHFTSQNRLLIEHSGMADAISIQRKGEKCQKRNCPSSPQFWCMVPLPHPIALVKKEILSNGGGGNWEGGLVVPGRWSKLKNFFLGKLRQDFLESPNRNISYGDLLKLKMRFSSRRWSSNTIRRCPRMKLRL